MPHIFAFSFSLVTLKFSIHNVFKTRVLLKISDIEFPNKCSYLEPFYLPAKMAAETMIMSIIIPFCVPLFIHTWSRYIFGICLSDTNAPLSIHSVCSTLDSLSSEVVSTRLK